MIFRKGNLVEILALLDRILVVGLKLIDADHLIRRSINSKMNRKNREEDAEGDRDKRYKVAKGRECEPHH